MEITTVRQSLHKLIDEIEDLHLLDLHFQLLQKEQSKKNIFNTSNEELIKRAKASLKSVQEGNTRPLSSFQREVEQWMGQPTK